MSTPQIRLKTESFRAIEKADIIINGITVVAGENGCGKSTLSKLLYFLYKTVSNYDLLVTAGLKTKLRDIIQFLDIVEHEIMVSSKDKFKVDFLRKERRELIQDILTQPLTDETVDRWLALIQMTSEAYNASQQSGIKRLSLRSNRLRFIVGEILSDKIEENKESLDLPFEKISLKLEGHFKEAFGKIKSRPTSLFVEALRSVFSEGELPKKFEVLEFDDPIISTDRNNLAIPYSIQNTIYIDTPMMIGVSDSENEHWNDLNELLVRRGKSTSPLISNLISHEIINGNVSVDDGPSSTDFSYKRSDGSVFNLLDCATGIKSFAIIQLLLKNGSLTDKTLLIIDEPESHLHPQWIIEYARLIVLLNKEIGIKFFIASHNPDMVSAIKYISEKENVAQNLNFYLAFRSEGKFHYDYAHLGNEIDPIFDSFNIAIERINQYGV